MPSVSARSGSGRSRLAIRPRDDLALAPAGYEGFDARIAATARSQRLSSSASLEIAVGRALRTCTHSRRRRRAGWAGQRAENGWCAPVGIMARCVQLADERAALSSTQDLRFERVALPAGAALVVITRDSRTARNRATRRVVGSAPAGCAARLTTPGAARPTQAAARLPPPWKGYPARAHGKPRAGDRVALETGDLSSRAPLRRIPRVASRRYRCRFGGRRAGGVDQRLPVSTAPDYGRGVRRVHRALADQAQAHELRRRHGELSACDGTDAGRHVPRGSFRRSGTLIDHCRAWPAPASTLTDSASLGRVSGPQGQLDIICSHTFAGTSSSNVLKHLLTRFAETGGFFVEEPLRDARARGSKSARTRRRGHRGAHIPANVSTWGGRSSGLCRQFD